MIANTVADDPWRALCPLEANRIADRNLIDLTRRDELAIVNNMIAASRVSILYAMSGNGKTSLLQAGVIPFFAEQGYIVLTTRPRPPISPVDPRRAFRDCIIAQVPLELARSVDRRSLDAIAAVAAKQEGEAARAMRRTLDRLRVLADALPADEQLREDVEAKLAGTATASLRDFVDKVAECLGRERPILIVLDQFEELFVHYANSPTLEAFISELAAIWSDTSLDVHMLFSMREDWVGSMIALRRSIPDVFKDYYRLLPITASVAKTVLQVPLKDRGFSFTPDAIEAILSDLADCYTQTEKRRLGRIETDRSAERFVELPALQLVASRMWATRGDHEPPFTLSHYRAMKDGDEAAPSPAAHVLDSYLLDAIGRTEETASSRETVVDALYFLTDGERHRRAASADLIEREIARNRATALRRAPVSAAAVHTALAPLVEQGLVRKVQTPSGTEYELSHDFAVRAVVKAWREVYIARAKELGQIERERDEKDARLEQLESRNDLVNRFLQLAPGVGLIGSVWATVLAINGDLTTKNFSAVASGAGLLMFFAYLLILAGGIYNRHKRSMAIALVAITTFALVHGVLSDRERKIAERIQRQNNVLKQIASVANDSVERLDVPRSSEPALDLMRVISIARRLTTAAENQDTSLTVSLLTSLLDTIRESRFRLMRSNYADYRAVDDLGSRMSGLQDQLGPTLRSSELELTVLTWLLAMVSVVLLVLWLVSAASLQPPGDRLGLILRLSSAELVDALLLATTIAFIPWLIVLEFDPSFEVIVGYYILAFLVRIFILWRSSTTFGLRVAGYMLRPAAHEERIGVVSALVRETAFVLWTALNVFFLTPLLIISPLLFWKFGRGVYDTVAKARPVPYVRRAPKATEPKPQPAVSDAMAA
jgi:hypothetical protein